ncbi:MutS-related protein [Persicitalea jodogahamensis]|uniref:DNA mismatch repair protein n=1 Tax=Persicitalea jodogahamensis TaxID=402147 RepID=A0A8J3G8X0_9BACT|nr:DNA mismatch repair protein MutS [Persicitalea jodogahamensis]GHB68768.1 DNA mismatch repair protein [Persicitalea jodogahamensis]
MEQNFSPADYFQAQLKDATGKEEVAQQLFNGLAGGRLLSFVALVVSLGLWSNQNEPLWGVLGLAAGILFVALMGRQQKAKRRRNFLRNLQTTNTDELARLDFKFLRSETGEQYTDPLHPYATDLDVFGKHSLYRLLNRTRTDEGSRRLAHWLTRPAPLDEILMRQEAVREFKSHVDWRQSWEATALLHDHASQQVGALRTWVNEVMDESLQKSLRWRWWPAVTVVLGVLAALGILSSWFFWLSILWQGFILKRYNAGIQDLTNRTTDLGLTLVAYADLLELANDAPHQSRWWQLRQNAINKASAAIRTVGQWFARLDYRLHPIFLIFVGIPFLWDLHCLAALEKWKKAHGTELAAWLDALADTEAMNSLSGFAFAHPNYPLPQVAWEDDVHIEAAQMGHPLIPAEARVSNDFSLVGTGHTMLVTGSNMSGKSTFLRTVGINLVLAQMGTVVCAESLACAPVQVFSSMRTQDSLVENTSSFYAELKRLRQLLELAGDSARQLPIFYLLDEILKGTNSADRHRGAEALIKQLHPLPASGMVSTHDLELGEWGVTQPFVQNFHFRSDVQDGKLVFDYRLHEGICQSFNASELMRMMGIAVGE